METPEGARGRVRFPARGGRLRDAFNRCVALTAVAGLALSGWAVWLEAEEHRDRQASRARITDACAGLADPDRVLGLHGGTARAVQGSDATQWFTKDTTPGRCVIYRVGEPGTTYGHFEMKVWTNPAELETNVVGAAVHPFLQQSRSDLTAPAPLDVTRRADHSPDYPLDNPGEDDGRLGHYNDDSVTFKVTCEKPKNDITSVNVRTWADYDDVSFTDRLTLIELAADAAYKAADHFRCTPEQRLPGTFARLWIPDPELKAAGSAEGSCRWYADFLRAEGGDARLPDRALASPAGEHSFKETCLLAASSARVKRAWPTLSGESVPDLDHVLDDSPWHLQTDSFFGDEAREVTPTGFGDRGSRIEPGTAGQFSGSVWWASSTCAGEPAVHTLSVSTSYADVAGPHLRALFRSYVDRVTAARDCENITFPSPSELPSA
ncbi:hypothetical protein [Streptomyces sp. JV178]|uniref:hypothetical protein n=1 Tax=Streptomyces sp. JV178 TaxID=858632 RepID=UPI0015D5679A|nr:hypothetical protein [Streptomyces sp. JV178]